MQPKTAAKMEFHIARQARDRYQFDEALFSLNGNVVFANFHAARVFAQKMNARRDLVNFPERVIRAGQINAMGLIDEILHFVMGMYRQQRSPLVMGLALDWLNEKVGAEAVDQALRQFTEQFPPLAVYRREMSLEDYLAGQSILPTGASVSNRQLVLEEMLMLWLENANPAFAPYLDLFDDTALEKGTAYPEIISGLHDFFDTQPTFGPDAQNLLDMLRSPAIAVPHSLTGQLEYIRTRWGMLLGRYLYRLLSSLDLIKEEEKAIFGVGGGGQSYVLEFGGLELEAERFSPDKDWMPNLMLMAKNSYVWLDQLSRKYKRAITRLDEIPDEELDQLARWGFTGLWLIGLWERSAASQKIKQLRGNPDAVASAYSLFAYDIAGDLGGEEAYQALRDRAWKRGIRLASDMVPNHMGIDSRWLIDHPDWFVSLDYSPFPSYNFNGPNLSWDNRVGLYLEDHYYNNTDAAVVFKRVDFWSGSEKYIYHGNDGTSMPWNDTAQLNYLNAEVREAVIQTILHVARKFPVIRFDAAMTLAKKHYQRLWYPEPGTGGAIPSRAEHGLTKEQFDAIFPEEFWREVVDRVAREVPDTLLLAEAFWLMEGYFVRTLGMHRVYNSAFMNMLRDEKNQEYRLVVKNTLEFDPEILKRYVNFMNNPDERTAVDQFGKSDKYFGVCTLMATMPGLPMFGHGQVEGYTEKYGMEFRRAYWDERPDGYLVERHEREIFPLLRRRYLFAGVENFLLYDFYNTEGYVNEDVYAYSNRSGGERALVVYHNKYAETRGWVRLSSASLVKGASGSEGKVLVQKTLGEGLELRKDPDYYAIFRDHTTGLEFIRNSRELHENGLYVELAAYQYQVFLDFREVQDNEWHQYAQLAGYLNGRGVPDIDEALKEIFLQPIHRPFHELVNAGFFHWLRENRLKVERQPVKAPIKPSTPHPSTLQQALDEAEQKSLVLLREVQRLGEGPSAKDGSSPEEIAHEIRSELAAILSLPTLESRFPAPHTRKFKAALKLLLEGPAGAPESPLLGGLASSDPAFWSVLFGWLFTHKLGKVLDATDYSEQSRAWIDEWLLGRIITACLVDLGLSAAAAQRSVAIIKLLIGRERWCVSPAEADSSAYRILQGWLNSAEIQGFLGVNRYQGVLWFNKESFVELAWWLFVLSTIDITAAESGAGGASSDGAKTITGCYEIVQKLLDAEEQSGYQVEKLLEAAK
ncbi:MAG TPA: alpha-amylase family glycosyl hydrolase [Anaerolineales bacterium]